MAAGSRSLVPWAGVNSARPVSQMLIYLRSQVAPRRREIAIGLKVAVRCWQTEAGALRGALEGPASVRRGFGRIAR